MLRLRIWTRFRRTTSLLLGLCFVSALLSGKAQTTSPLLPTSVAYDSVGNLYFADTNRHQIFESTLAGKLLLIAGTGVQGYAGDGGAATSAQLNSPQGVAVGSDGTIYIADTGNQRIRAVVAGQIATFAGTGAAGFAGDNGPASAAIFHQPTALALDASGALLICDSDNQRVRRIRAGIVTTVAGSGVQGYSGDGGIATAAQLDTPLGIAISADGRIFIADTHNDRVRVVATNGTISTFAGTGVRGYSGDGSVATAAQLSLPRGLSVTSAGALLIADSNNHRVRSVDTQGTITTVAGDGVQGAVSDGTGAGVASLNTPRGVADSSFGAPVLADPLAKTVQEVVGNGSIYAPAGLVPTRSSSVLLTVPANATNGLWSATATVTGIAGVPQGTVQLLDGSSLLAQGSLTAGAVSFSSLQLATGPHSLSAVYAGDGVNPAASSSSVTRTVALITATATANPASMEYGQSVPALTGTLTGILPQDAGNVSVVFTTTATSSSSPGMYPILAMLTGPASANYSLVLGATSGSLQVVKAPSLTVLQPLAQSSFAGLPLVMTVTVASTTQGIPTGSVSFLDGAMTVATAPLSQGMATGTYLSPAAGMHSITASYSGDTNFTASNSAAVSTTVGTIPSFTLTTLGSATQMVLAGNIATYNFSIAAQPAPFTGVVLMAVSGLPTGVTASFAPPQVVPGAGSAAVVLSLQTPVPLVRCGWPLSSLSRLAIAALALPLFFVRRRRRTIRLSSIVYLLSVGLAVTIGCGDRTLSSASLGSQTYQLNVTATSTDLTGAPVVHSTQIILVVQ